jgi:hypothetical protein
MNDEVSRPITRREIPDDYESPAFFGEPTGLPSSAPVSGSGATVFMTL